MATSDMRRLTARCSCLSNLFPFQDRLAIAGYTVAQIEIDQVLVRHAANSMFNIIDQGLLSHDPATSAFIPTVTPLVDGTFIAVQQVGTGLASWDQRIEVLRSEIGRRLRGVRRQVTRRHGRRGLFPHLFARCQRAVLGSWSPGSARAAEGLNRGSGRASFLPADRSPIPDHFRSARAQMVMAQSEL